MVVNHKKLREATIRKFKMFYSHKTILVWELVAFIYRHYKDYQAWLKIQKRRGAQNKAIGAGHINNFI